MAKAKINPVTVVTNGEPQPATPIDKKARLAWLEEKKTILQERLELVKDNPDKQEKRQMVEERLAKVRAEIEQLKGGDSNR